MNYTKLQIDRYAQAMDENFDLLLRFLDLVIAGEEHVASTGKEKNSLECLFIQHSDDGLTVLTTVDAVKAHLSNT